jgi:shikimate dehydrogenase
MKRAYLLGYPVGHSISPQIYGAAFKAMSLDSTLEARATPPEELPAVVVSLRDDGCYGASVTIPHKQAVVPLIDGLDDAARAIGAVNCIVNRDGKLSGYNTDYAGFQRSLLESGFRPDGPSTGSGRSAKAVVLGAGGSARAVVAALVDTGVGSILLTARSGVKAEEAASSLRQDLGTSADGIVGLGWDDIDRFEAACRQAKLIVNCTPLGMTGSGNEDRSPIAASLIPKGSVVLDLVYNPVETPLLRDARAAGATAVSGLDMLVYQGAAAIKLWTGEEPPVDIMKTAAAEAIAARRQHA